MGDWLFTAVTVLAVVSSQVMGLSAIPSILEIRKAGSTLLYPADPFITALCSAVFNFGYSFLTGQLSVVLSTTASACQNATYLYIHFQFSRDPPALRSKAARYIATAALIAFPLPIAWSLFVPNHSAFQFAKLWLGTCATAASTIVYCAQLVKLQSIIETKNSASISPPLTAGTLFCAFMWTTYSVMQKDYFYIFSSAVGVLSALSQVGLMIVYPRNLPDSHEELTDVEVGPIGIK